MTESAGIYRARLSLDGNFTIVPNEWLRSEEINPGAKLLLIYLYSHEIGYTIKDPQIMRETGLGRYALRSARNELQDLGWIQTKRVRRDDNTLDGYQYFLAEARGQFSPDEDSPDEHSPDENQPRNRRQSFKKTTSKKTTVSKPSNADDYVPTDEFLERCRTEYAGLNLEVELQKFRNHHMAKGNTFKDYDRAFMNWLFKASDWSPEARAARVRAEEEAKFEQWKRENGEY